MLVNDYYKEENSHSTNGYAVTYGSYFITSFVVYQLFKKLFKKVFQKLFFLDQN